MSEQTPTFVPYWQWIQEAEQVAQEELQQYGMSPSPDSIMRRAQGYVTEVQQNEHGGLRGVMVWDGWQQAMRRSTR